MEPERWKQVGEIFVAALEKGEKERPRFLEQACGGDDSLRHEVEKLLGSHDDAGEFLEKSVVESGGGLPARFEGKFEILHKISEGGMGAVYKVRHLLLDQEQVIKVIRPQHGGDENLKLRFLHEARTATRLRHPNIALLHDFSIGEGGTAYIVMEYIDGKTLKEILRESGPPPLALALEIARQSLDALSYLHRRGFIHRDIAPDNLMLTHSFDGSPLVKLIDLGLAKRLGATSVLTSSGMFLGKIRYSSPEQFNDRVELDERSDIYSFGVVLYQLLTGHLPIRGDQFHTLMTGHLVHPPLAFEHSDPEGRVPQGLREIVLETLEKDPADRVATAAELARLLEPYRKRAGSPGLEPAESPVGGAAPAGDEPDVTQRTEVHRLPIGRRQRTRESPETEPTLPALRQALPQRRRARAVWALGLGAAVLSAVVASWVVATRSPVEPAEIPVAEAKYLLALQRKEEGDLRAAATLLRQARDADPDEKLAPNWVTPGTEGAYLPHYHLAQVQFELSRNCVEALEGWKESERQGVVQETPHYETLRRSRAKCEAQYEGVIADIDRNLDDAKRFAELLEEALENSALSGFWRRSPELEKDVRQKLRHLRDLRQTLDEGRKNSTDLALLNLETPAMDIKEELDRLLEQVKELSRSEVSSRDGPAL